MRKHVQVFYNGTVQGVGFRYTAREIADEFGIFGWVKNLRDGRVELVAQGEEGLLRDYLDKINAYFSAYIVGMDIQWKAASEEFKEFNIRF